jgi:hypothetical protein
VLHGTNRRARPPHRFESAGGVTDRIGVDMAEITVIRRCHRCGVRRPLKDFYASKKHRACRYCTQAKMNARTARQTEYTRRVKLEAGCMDCGLKSIAGPAPPSGRGTAGLTHARRIASTLLPGWSTQHDHGGGARGVPMRARPSRHPWVLATGGARRRDLAGPAPTPCAAPARAGRRTTRAPHLPAMQAR